MLDLLGVVGFIAILIGALILLHVIAGGLALGIILVVIGVLCLGGFGPRLGAGRRYGP